MGVLETIDIANYGHGVTRSLDKANKPLRLSFGELNIELSKILVMERENGAIRVQAVTGEIYTFNGKSWVRENQ